MSAKPWKPSIGRATGPRPLRAHPPAGCSVVPYPLPLDQPQVTLPFTRRRFRTLAENVAVETSIDIHLVRDPDKTIESVLEPHSIIVMVAAAPGGPTPIAE